jgi:hypothetical protein
MGFIKGLASVQEELNKRGGDYADRPKAEWVSLKGGESVKLEFLQEIDEASPNYNKDRGTALFSLQHSNPDDWQKTAKCTEDEGDCYGCQRGWRQKLVLYVNVLVDDNVKDPYVAIWNRGLGKGSVAASLIAMASDEDFDNSISDKTFKFTRSGKTKDDTTYSLDALPKRTKYDTKDVKLYNLEDYVFTVPYERQEAYYLGLKKGESAPEEKAKPQSADAIDQDW